MKIAVVGSGYVGTSNAVLLAQHHEVVVLDIVAEKVALINARKSPIEDTEMEHYLAHKSLHLKATLDKTQAYGGADFVIIATPTDYDPASNYFNTQSIESVVADVMVIAPPRGDGDQEHRASRLYRKAARANWQQQHYF
jgi:UDPglucose 6-dehydrogenase